MQIVPKLGMLTIVEIEAELMNNFTFVEMTVSYSMIKEKKIITMNNAGAGF